MNPTTEYSFPTLQQVDLQTGHPAWMGRVDEAVLRELSFEGIWDLHPERRPQIRMIGKMVGLPRWQQAYGSNYNFSGQTSVALPVPPALQPILDWARATIDQRLNGLLLNWYEGQEQHYIGPHKDSTKDLVPCVPIVTVSLGATRVFRFSRRASDGSVERRDFPVPDGSVLVFSREVNEHWKHSVPHRKVDSGRRISVTIRAFTNGTSAP